jgi:hypothetical protein
MEWSLSTAARLALVRDNAMMANSGYGHNVDRPRKRRCGRLLTLAAPLCLALVGCGGGDDGIGLASGQGPDPVVVDVPIAYVKRSIPLNADGAVVTTDARRLLGTFVPGADLVIRERASPSALERNITGELTQGQYDVRDVSVSWDGERLVFAMRGPFIENADPDDQPTWNIWQYDRIAAQLRRIIGSNLTAELGHDISPHYLPDGRIVFTSTRQRESKAMLLDEGKPQFDALDEDLREPAFVLHVMNEDGTDIRQISFNQSHDRDPTVLDNGQIVFSRWDRYGSRNEISLYRMNPDGTQLELLYGKNSRNTGPDGVDVHFLRPRQMPDGRLLVLAQPFQVRYLGGDLVIIDVDNYVENVQALARNAGVLSGPAQSAATISEVRPGQMISPGGQYSAAWPLRDGTDRMFVSWSQCRLLEAGRIVPCNAERLTDPAAVAAPPLYGIWIYNRATDTQLPVLQPQEGVVYTEVVAMQSRPLPSIIFDQISGGGVNAQLAEQGLGLLNIRSVYDVLGQDISAAGIAVLADPAQRSFAQRPAAWLRILKAVAIPDDEVRDFNRGVAFGRGGVRGGMREILGYAPIEPDGSVFVQVPANVPLSISVLDSDGRRSRPRHQNWLQVRPGQTLSCTGCHQPATGQSHGRSDAFDSAWSGAPSSSVPFPNTSPALFAQFGETMAEAKARISCATDCALIRPSVDILFDDIWTHEPTAGRAPDASIAWRYADLETPAPVSQACQQQWTAACRIVINYEAHLQPLWELPREVFDEDGFTVLADNTCIVCHARRDAMDQLQVPAGQLELTGDPSRVQALQLTSYRELLFPDTQLELVEGALQQRLVEVGVNEDTGEPILVTVAAPASMIASNARGSTRFFNRFTAGGSHEGLLSPAELRLISEWLDIGAQYYNNPFDAPVAN